MDYSKRTNEWIEKFYNHLDKTNPDLVMYFYTKIFFSPNVENPAILHAGYSPIDDTEGQKEISKRMFIVFEEFQRDNPV